MGDRVTVILDEGVSELLIELAGGSRRQGEYLSRLIRSVWQTQRAGSSEGLDIEGLRLQVLGLAASIKQIEGRLLQTEKTLAVLIADRAGR